MEKFFGETSSSSSTGKTCKITQPNATSTKQSCTMDVNAEVKDSISTLSRYKFLLEKYSPIAKKYENVPVEGLIAMYRMGDYTEKEKEVLKTLAFLKTIFLVPYTIKTRYKMQYSLYNDAIQNASMTMLTAMDIFDPNKGFTFSHYNLGYFRSAIAKTFSDTNIVKRPAKAFKKEKATSSITAAPKKRGRKSTAEKKAIARREIQLSLLEDMSANEEERIKEEMSSSHYPNASDSTKYIQYDDDFNCIDYSDQRSTDNDISYIVSDDPETGCYSFDDNLAIESMSTDPEVVDKIYTNQLKDLVARAIDPKTGLLSDDERMVLIMHAGLNGLEEKTYKEISDFRKGLGRGWSRSRISQLNKSACKKLKEFAIQNNVTAIW